MTEIAPPPPPPAPVPGFFSREIARLLPHAETDAAKVIGRMAGLLQDRGGEALDVAGDFLALVKLIDPADAPLVTAAQALLPKVLGMAENAARDARTALGG